METERIIDQLDDDKAYLILHSILGFRKQHTQMKGSEIKRLIPHDLKSEEELTYFFEEIN